MKRSRHWNTSCLVNSRKKALEGTPDDSGLRFDESVPVEEIALSTPELEGPDAEDYEIIGQKSTYRLAQRPANLVILKYTRPVIKAGRKKERQDEPCLLLAHLWGSGRSVLHLLAIAGDAAYPGPAE